MPNLTAYHLPVRVSSLTAKQARDRFFWHWENCEQCKIASWKTHRHEDHCDEARQCFDRLMGR